MCSCVLLCVCFPPGLVYFRKLELFLNKGGFLVPVSMDTEGTVVSPEI